MGRRTLSCLQVEGLLAWIGRDAGQPELFLAHIDRIGDAMPAEWIEEGGPWTSADEAVSWARDRAEQVVVTYGYADETVFSAGSVPYTEESLPQWPPDPETRGRIDAAVRAANAFPPPPAPGQISVGMPGLHDSRMAEGGPTA
jgi:hypothetical protein